MKFFVKAPILLALAVVTCSSPLKAQEGEFGEDSKLNTNLAMTFSVPLNPIAKFTNLGWGTTVGAGYNFNSHNAIIGEFLWNHMYPTPEVLAPIRLALNSADVNGHANVYALTANYRLEFRGKSKGIYFIGGGGIYRRNTSLTQEVPNGTATTCTPAWAWWGFSCTSGVVTTDVTLANRASTVFGYNGGMGLTVKVGEPRYRMYIEARYHYAPTSRINTQIIPITMGIRF